MDSPLGAVNWGKTCHSDAKKNLVFQKGPEISHRMSPALRASFPMRFAFSRNSSGMSSPAKKRRHKMPAVEPRKACCRPVTMTSVPSWERAETLALLRPRHNCKAVPCSPLLKRLPCWQLHTWAKMTTYNNKSTSPDLCELCRPRCRNSPLNQKTRVSQFRVKPSMHSCNISR